jgi:Prealbumin-like fold domain
MKWFKVGGDNDSGVPSARRRKGRVETGKRLLVAGAVLGLLAAVLGTSTAAANLPGSTFEGGDGNLIVNTPGNTDWANVSGLVTGNDLPTGQQDNSFGNGTKENDLNVTVGLGSIPNSKADLGKFLFASETAADGDVLMYLGWTRVNTSGTTNFDFEINKAAQPDLTTPGPKTLVRTEGDLLISYDFQGGAQRPTLALRTWLASGVWSGPTPLAAPVAEAEVNRVAALDPLTDPDSTLAAFTFGEAAINLTEAGVIDPNECTGFSSAYVKSRASDAFTSAVKDFIAPQPIEIDTCGTIIIEKVTDPDPDTTNTSFPFTLTGGPSALNESFSLLNGESHTTTPVRPGSGYVAAEVAPAGWDLDSATCDDGSPVTNIDVGNNETVTCTFTNMARANLHVVKVAERDGVNFDFTTTGGLTPATFTLQNGGQQDFLSLVPGTYGTAETVPEGWDLESATCDNGDDPDAVDLGPGDDVTCTYTNVVERGALSIHKSAKHAAAPGGTKNHGGVTFTVTNATNGTSAVVETDADGNACVADLPVSFLDGDYTITETVPAGYVNAEPVQTYTVVEDTDCDSAEVASFVNTPLTNLSVVVDSQIEGGTASTIECVPGGSTATGPSGDGSLDLTDLEPGTYVCTVVVDP